VTNFNGGLREALRVAAVMGAASVAIAAVVLPRRSQLVPITEISTTTAVDAVAPLRNTTITIQSRGRNK
jgi:hypothetical protein